MLGAFRRSDVLVAHMLGTGSAAVLAVRVTLRSIATALVIRCRRCYEFTRVTDVASRGDMKIWFESVTEPVST